MQFIKYPKIYILGHDKNKSIFENPNDEIIVEEKIDGGNFRVMIKGVQIIFGSRNLDIDDKDEKNAKLFSRAIQFVKHQFESLPAGTLQDGIYFMENCVKHTLSYDWDKIPPVLGFDIMIFEGETSRFLGYNERKELFDKFKIQMVPLIKIAKASEFNKPITDDDVPVSAYVSPSTQDRQAEGLVYKNYAKQLMAKFVRDKFKEDAAIAFGGNPKYNKIGSTDNEMILFKYCTNARIEKNVFKLIDEGNKLEMKLMESLPKRVYKDIWEEHWTDLMISRFTIDFDALRKQVTKRSLAVLKQIIVNNAFEVKK